MKDNIDCIIVGYNEIDVNTIVSHAARMKRYSGVYRHLMQNVVQSNGNWQHYMDLLNSTLKDATQKEYSLHPMELPNLGVCYLKSYLMRNGFSVAIINFFNRDKDKYADMLRRGSLAVAITTTFYTDDTPVKEIIQFTRRHSSETIAIVGGPYIYNISSQSDAITRDYCLQNMGADIYICDTQGENTLSRVLYKLQKRGMQNLDEVPNLIYRNDRNNHSTAFADHRDISPSSLLPRAVFTETAREIERNNLDDTAIDWSIFENSVYRSTVSLRTARGCAYDCAFCSYSAFAGPLTLMRVSTIETQMKQLHKSGVKNLVFVDDSFNVPLQRFKNILRMMIDNGFNFNWFSFFRCSFSDDDTYDLMRESGCRAVFLGIESGSQNMLDNMNKNTTIEGYKKGIRELKDRNIITFGSFVVGFPGETEETIEDTINFIQETRLKYYKAELFYYSDKAPIHKIRHKYNLRGGGFSWSHSTMDWKKACDMIDRIYSKTKQSTIVPLYMFDFWSIPYLLGRGISLDQIGEFVILCQPLLLKNNDTGSFDSYKEDIIRKKLIVLGKKLACNIE